jgi:hypothetical protein
MSVSSRFAQIVFITSLMIGMALVGPPSVVAQSGEFNFIAYGDTRGNAPDSVSPLHGHISMTQYQPFGMPGYHSMARLEIMSTTLMIGV